MWLVLLSSIVALLIFLITQSLFELGDVGKRYPKVKLQRGTDYPLTICMVSDDFLPLATGVGSHLQAVTQLLSQRGHRISIITSRRAGEPEVEIWNGIKIYRVFTIPVFGFYQALPSMATLRRLFMEVKPDIVHYHYVSIMTLRSLIVCNRLGLRQIYTYHMTVDHLVQPLLMRPFRGIIARQIQSICNRVDLVVSVSKNLALLLPGTGILTQVKYISNPIALVRPALVVPMTKEAGFTVMYSGRLNPEKNISFLIRSFALLLKRIPDAQLIIAGMGNDLEALKCLCTRLHLSLTQQVKFLGFLDHLTLSRYYASCDVFVLPSWVETQGLVAMEAMWFSKPIIVSQSVVSATELVDPEENSPERNGFLVIPDNDAQLAQYLIMLANDSSLRIKLGRAGNRRTKEFEADTVVDKLDAAYREIIAKTNDGRL